jgi:hypothetical protein
MTSWPHQAGTYGFRPHTPLGIIIIIICFNKLYFNKLYFKKLYFNKLYFRSIPPAAQRGGFSPSTARPWVIFSILASSILASSPHRAGTYGFRAHAPLGIVQCGLQRVEHIGLVGVDLRKG